MEATLLSLSYERLVPNLRVPPLCVAAFCPSIMARPSEIVLSITAGLLRHVTVKVKDIGTTLAVTTSVSRLNAHRRLFYTD